MPRSGIVGCIVLLEIFIGLHPNQYLNHLRIFAMGADWDSSVLNSAPKQHPIPESWAAWSFYGLIEDPSAGLSKPSRSQGFHRRRVLDHRSNSYFWRSGTPLDQESPGGQYLNLLPPFDRDPTWNESREAIFDPDLPFSAILSFRRSFIPL